MSSPQTSFAVVLRRLRNEKGLSQEQLALKGGLDRTFISLMERGLRQPSLSTFISIAQVLECTPSYLMSIIEKEMQLSEENQRNLE